MTKEVLVTISGFQIMDGENHDVQLITAGDYYQKNGKHYISYDEVEEGVEGRIHNIIKITPDSLDIMKSGITRAHMKFEKNQKNVACYVTPFGNMMVGIHTDAISLAENEDHLKIEVDYKLDINYEHVSDCSISVDIQSRSKAELNLQS